MMPGLSMSSLWGGEELTFKTKAFKSVKVDILRY